MRMSELASVEAERKNGTRIRALIDVVICMNQEGDGRERMRSRQQREREREESPINEHSLPPSLACVRVKMGSCCNEITRLLLLSTLSLPPDPPASLLLTR